MTLDRTAPIFNRLPHSRSTLERIATDALRKHEDVLPKSPDAVLIERLIENEFGFNETYVKLESGVLGEIYFGVDDRPIQIRISQRLGEIDTSAPNIDHERRGTLAHECGHGLVHSRLFAHLLRRERAPRLPGFDIQQNHITCRDHDIHGAAKHPTANACDELWLEWEANYLMGALLLPRDLVFTLLAPFLAGTSNGITPTLLPASLRTEATALTAGTFNVSHDLAARRLETILPPTSDLDLFSAKTPVESFSVETLRPQTRSRRNLIQRLKT